MSRYPSNETAQRLIEFLREHPMGMGGREIRERLGVCESWFNAMARQAKFMGAVVSRSGGKWTVWFATEHVGNYMPRERKEWELRSMEKKKIMRELRDDDFGEQAIVQTVVPASNAAPINKIGPASVFEWASCVGRQG